MIVKYDNRPQKEYRGHSWELPPQENVSVGSVYIEEDTGRKLRYDGRAWTCFEEAANVNTLALVEKVIKNYQPSSHKCLISIIDDDNHTTPDADFVPWLNERGIPLTFAVPANTTKGADPKVFHNNDALKELVKQGNEVVMHGNTDFNSSTASFQKFKEEVDLSVEWATKNGFRNDIWVYPSGMQPDRAIEMEKKIAYLEEKGIRLAYSVPTGVENAKTVGFEEWYDINRRGFCNQIPFQSMLNGISKALMANRWQANQFVLSNKTRITNMIDQHDHICIYTHSFASDGQTVTANLKECIEWVIETFGDQVQWVTPSQVLAYNDSINPTSYRIENLLDKRIKTLGLTK